MLSQNRRITIRDVARAGGVSVQTVSRVVNNRPDVSTETRKRVTGVIEALGYHPSEVARSLVQRRSLTLGVVTAGLNQIGPSRTLNGITAKAEELGYGILLKELHGFSVDDLQPILRSLLVRQVDGVVWAVPEVHNDGHVMAERLDDIGVPIIFLTMEPQPGISTFSIDNYAGGVLATRHLIELGRKRIAHISGPLSWWEARQRKQGWCDTLERAGRRVPDGHSAEGDWSAASGQSAFDQLLVSFPRMDAVFVANDQMALSVLRSAGRKGIRVPDELAVVGFDNMPESAYFSPPLTSISQSQQDLGARAVETLVRRIQTTHNGEPMPTLQTLIAPRLVVRESSVPRQDREA